MLNNGGILVNENLVWGEAMTQEFGREIGHFATMVLAYALALMIIVLLLWLLRKLEWRLPKELVGFLERLIDTGAHGARTSVNVEYRDVSGEIIDLGQYVPVTLRSSRGNASSLHEGCFVHCDQHRIKPRTAAVVSILDGQIKETVWVQVDLEKDILFVVSKFKKEELIGKINRRLNEPPKLVPEGSTLSRAGLE